MKRLSVLSLMVLLLCIRVLAASAAVAGEPVISQIQSSNRDFREPHDIVLSADGSLLFVADKYSNSIKLISPEGELVQVLGGGKSGIFDRPEGVEIRGGDLWFSDTYNNRIVRYRMMSR